jgi:hypothetical protein
LIVIEIFPREYLSFVNNVIERPTCRAADFASWMGISGNFDDGRISVGPVAAGVAGFVAGVAGAGVGGVVLSLFTLFVLSVHPETATTTIKLDITPKS